MPKHTQCPPSHYLNLVELLSTCSVLTTELRLFTLSILSESHNDHIRWVWPSCPYYRWGNWSSEQLYVQCHTISKQQSFNSNPGLTDPRVCVLCCFPAYDHMYRYTRKVDQGQNQGTWGIRKTSWKSGLDHMWRRRADRKHIASSLNLLTDAKEKIQQKLKCSSQTIQSLLLSVWSTSQEHKHPLGACEKCQISGPSQTC